jgi:hypothetical protein
MKENIKFSKTLSPDKYRGSPIKAINSGSVMSAATINPPKKQAINEYN